MRVPAGHIPRVPIRPTRQGLYVPQPRLAVTPENGALVARASGDWIIEHAAAIAARMKRLSRRVPAAGILEVHCDGVTRLDTAGAWLLQSTVERLRRAGCEARLLGFRRASFRVLEELPESTGDHCQGVHRSLRERLETLGRAVVDGLRHLLEAAGFLGRVFAMIGRCTCTPRRLRLPAVIANMYRAGVTASPIVALLAFLISIALTYQGSVQLQRFGAEVFTVDLTAVTVLRELGVVLTAILVAGRSGSAFAAEIGVMQINEEVAAMQTMALDPLEVLVLPRIMALVLMLPLLTVLADLAGLAGGALSAALLLDLAPDAYLQQVQAAITPWTFWSGLIKAPVFAFLIATTACFWGMRASGSAENVGRLTTVAVVQAIFLVILADAAFSVIYTQLGL